jgi:hypothetical protein
MSAGKFLLPISFSAEDLKLFSILFNEDCHLLNLPQKIIIKALTYCEVKSIKAGKLIEVVGCLSNADLLEVSLYNFSHFFIKNYVKRKELKG